MRGLSITGSIAGLVVLAAIYDPTHLAVLGPATLGLCLVLWAKKRPGENETESTEMKRK